MSALPVFIAYVYPGWHASPFRPGFDEWKLLDRFRPYYEGHVAPPRPKAGYYDDSRPETAEASMRQASAYGIAGFSYFAYYRRGGFVLDAPVDAAFARAGTVSAFQLSLTLCLRLPHRTLPLPLDYRHWRDSPPAAAESCPQPDNSRQTEIQRQHTFSEVSELIGDSELEGFSVASFLRMKNCR